MNSLVTRNLKFYAHLYSIYLLSCLGAQAALFLYGYLISSDFHATNMNSFSVSVVSFFAFIVFFQQPSVYTGLSLSLCNTRRAVFLSSLLAKLVMCACLMLTALLAQLAAGALLFSSVADTTYAPPFYLLFYCGLLLAATVGELMGYLCHALGRFGMILFVIICMIFGMCAGVTFSLIASNHQLILPDFMQGAGLIFSVSAGVFALCVLLNGVNYLLNRRFVVK